MGAAEPRSLAVVPALLIQRPVREARNVDGGTAGIDGFLERVAESCLLLTALRVHARSKFAPLPLRDPAAHGRGPKASRRNSCRSMRWRASCAVYK